MLLSSAYRWGWMDQLELIAMMVAAVPQTWWQNTTFVWCGLVRLVLLLVLGGVEETPYVGISLLTSAVYLQKGLGGTLLVEAAACSRD
jgi:hypothetical protein